MAKESLIWEKKLKEALSIGKKWRFCDMAGSKSSLLFDSPIMCMQLTETTFTGILPVRIPQIG